MQGNLVDNISTQAGKFDLWLWSTLFSSEFWQLKVTGIMWGSSASLLHLMVFFIMEKKHSSQVLIIVGLSGHSELFTPTSISPIDNQTTLWSTLVY